MPFLVIGRCLEINEYWDWARMLMHDFALVAFEA